MAKSDLAENSAKTAKKKPRGKAFKPGQSGNPGGRPAKTEEQRTLEAMCREKTVEALAVVLAIMDGGESERTKLAAAEIVLERGHGKAVERQEQGKPGEFGEDKEALRHRADELNVKLGMGRAIRVSKPAVH